MTSVDIVDTSPHATLHNRMVSSPAYLYYRYTCTKYYNK